MAPPVDAPPDVCRAHAEMVDEARHVRGELLGRVALVAAAASSGSALVGDDDVVAGGESAYLAAPAGADARQTG